jgi:hypothetical protein
MNDVETRARDFEGAQNSDDMVELEIQIKIMGSMSLCRCESSK